MPTKTPTKKKAAPPSQPPPPKKTAVATADPEPPPPPPPAAPPPVAEDPPQPEPTPAISLRGPFTLNEIIEVERLTGQPMGQWFDRDQPQGALRRALVWTWGQREDPTFSLLAAGEVAMFTPAPEDKE